jgi:Xaa-Pro aminopeptidase
VPGALSHPASGVQARAVAARARATAPARPGSVNPRLLDLPTDALVARRARLAAAVDAPVLVPAGAPRPRTYPGNPYPFRAGSHFLYLAGAPLPGAFLHGEGGAFTVYAPEPGPEDALWHGQTPSFDALSEAIGCPVRPLGELAPAAGTLSVPAVDYATVAAQAERLGRDLDPTVDAPLLDALVALRLIHDEAAIAGLREAAAVTAEVHAAGMAATRPGLLESDVRAAMEAACLRRGLALSYGPIVTVHGEILHNDTHFHRLEEGDLLLADVGAESRHGWAGDVTRTWPVGGRFSGTQRAMYEAVRRAQEAAIEAVAPGVRYRDVHLRAARGLGEGLVELGILEGDVDELVADGVVALFFPHGIGHLIGLDVHDMEDLGDRAGYQDGRERAEAFGLRNLRLDRDLAPGMAVTIEPGLYQVPAILSDEALTAPAGDRLDREVLARFADVRGIRIEDDVLVTEDGREVLTRAIPKAPDAVEAAVGRAL